MSLLSDASVLSLSALLLAKADDHLPAGAHLRWHLHPDLGFPYAGFRLRRRAAPTWPWIKSEAIATDITRHNTATSVDGIHLTNVPLRIEQAALSSAATLLVNSKLPMRFVYEARAADDPPRQNLVRFALYFDIPITSTSYTITLRGFTQYGGEKRLVAERSLRVNRVGVGLSPRRGANQSLFISAAEMHSVEFSAPAGVQVKKVLFTPAELLHNQPDWETVTILTPLCLPGTPHAAAPADAQQLASQRLAANRPRRRPGLARTPEPGAVLNSIQHSGFESRVSAQAKDLAASLSAAYQLETRERRVPGSITLGDVASAVQPAHTGNDGSVDLPFYGMLQAGAFAPHIAAILGLGHHDQRASEGGPYDYAVDTLVGQLWLAISRMPPEQREQLKLNALPTTLIAPPLSTAWVQEPTGFTRLVAFLPDQQAGAVDTLPAPTLEATMRPDAARTPIQARAAIRARPGSPATRTLLWRQSTGISALNPLDPLTQLMLPAVPAAEDGYCRFEDDTLDGSGQLLYLAQDVDCFGRAGARAELPLEVRDILAPPAPPQPRITLGDVAADELHFPTTHLDTTLPATLLQAAPDLAAITFLWRAGHHSAAEVLAQPDGRAQASWPPPHGGHIVASTVSVRLQRSDIRRELSVICTAQDHSGNVSPPSLVSHAVLIDDIRPPAPPQPEHPQWTSWPDAHGETRWCLRWTLPPGATTARVSTAAESRLLALSGRDRDAHYALDHAQRATALKQLATNTPNAFIPEGLAYPPTLTRHDVVLPAGSDDLRVVVVEFIGTSGQKADWPGSPAAFAVVRARPSQPAQPPTIHVQATSSADIISISAHLPGVVQLYALSAPAQLKLLDLLQPIATLSLAGTAPAIHTHPRAQEPQWLGYCARLRAADGRVSVPTQVYWREHHDAQDA